MQALLAASEAARRHLDNMARCLSWKQAHNPQNSIQTEIETSHRTFTLNFHFLSTCRRCWQPARQAGGTWTAWPGACPGQPPPRGCSRASGGPCWAGGRCPLTCPCTTPGLPACPLSCSCRWVLHRLHSVSHMYLALLSYTPPDALAAEMVAEQSLQQLRSWNGIQS